VAWQPDRQRELSDGDRVAAAALAGPLVVVGTPRRQRLGGVSRGGAVDDGGVGRMARSTERPYRHPAVPSEPCFLSRVQTRYACFPSSCKAWIRHLGPATILLESRNVFRLHAEFVRYNPPRALTQSVGQDGSLLDTS
jgi:hypothetical protein